MPTLPQFKTQPSPKAVVDEHLDALNRSDWNRLMAQYPDDVEIFLPAGVVIRGRQQAGDAFAGMVKPWKDGGIAGVRFVPEHVFTIGDTVNLQWRAEADFLREPYRGADAYVTRNGLLAAQVSTFQRDQFKLK